MLEFRLAAADDNPSALETLSRQMGDAFKIDEPGPKSGKTAAHVAAERGCFKTIYWLFERNANFHLKDNSGKTPDDYLQQKEFTSIGSSPMSMGDRKYYLCNAHCKIWFAHDPELFMPYLYQEDFRQYREKNPDGFLSLVYSTALLSDKALSDLVEFAKKYQIILISFEKELAILIDQHGTEKDKLCYQAALYELNQYPDQKGGNLAVVSDLMRWSSVFLRKGSYADTDVEIGQHHWTNSISMDKALAINLGSMIYPNMTEPTPWLNGDIIAVSSLFPRPHLHGDFRITLSKTACFMIQVVQSRLLESCQKNMKSRIAAQQFTTKTLSDFSFYFKDYFNTSERHRSLSDHVLTNNFTLGEIDKIQAGGLEPFSKEEKASIIERMANLMRKKTEKDFDTPEMAHKYSSVFRDVKSDEHEKFLMNYLQAILMTNIKDGVMEVSGVNIFSRLVWECIKGDNWKKYSIYSSEVLQSAFRSKNTVRFDTTFADNQRQNKTEKLADLSFTSFGMKSVMQRSQALKASHANNNNSTVGSASDTNVTLD